MKLSQRTLVYFVAALMVAACVSTVEAQGRRGGQGGQGGRGGFQAPGARGGQGGFQRGQGGFQRGGFGGFGGGSSELGLLQRADVRKELELLDDQIKDLEAIDAREIMTGVFQGLQDVPQEERREKMQAAMESAQKKIRSKVDGVLLPHQATRLSQLTVQASMRTADGMTRGTVADQLGLTDEEREALREKARAIRAELEKKAVAELIKELPPAKQTKIKQLMGKPFTFVEEPRDRGARGGAGGIGGRQRGN